MNREETRMQLMAYVDGELNATEMKAVEAAVAADPELRAEFEGLRSLSSFAKMAFDAPVPEPKFDGVFAGVMARLGEDAKAYAAPARPAFGTRFRMWMQGFFAFERPLALAGFAAVAIAVVGVVALSGGDEQGAVAPQNIANTEGPELRRRGAEGEMRPEGRNSVIVQEAVVAPGGVLKIDEGVGEGDKPLVLWHVIEGEGVAIPDAGGAAAPEGSKL